jgi:hypothetical protein
MFSVGNGRARCFSFALIPSVPPDFDYRALSNDPEPNKEIFPENAS